MYSVCKSVISQHYWSDVLMLNLRKDIWTGVRSRATGGLWSVGGKYLNSRTTKQKGTMGPVVVTQVSAPQPPPHVKLLKKRFCRCRLFLLLFV